MIMPARNPRHEIEMAVREGCSSPLEVAAKTGIAVDLVRTVLRLLVDQGRIEQVNGLSSCKAVAPDSDATSARSGCASGTCNSCPLTG